MYLIISHDSELSDQTIKNLLSDMVYAVANIEDSSHLLFECAAKSENLQVWELSDSIFTPALVGVSMCCTILVPNSDITSIPFIKAVKEKAANYIKAFHDRAELDPDSIVNYTMLTDKLYTVILGHSKTVIDLETAMYGR